MPSSTRRRTGRDLLAVGVGGRVRSGRAGWVPRGTGRRGGVVRAGYRWPGLLRLRWLLWAAGCCGLSGLHVLSTQSSHAFVRPFQVLARGVGAQNQQEVRRESVERLPHLP